MLEIRVSTESRTLTFPLLHGARWLIGRGPGCDICVPTDRKISNEHAEIVRQGENLELRRTLGANPIVVNGIRVESALLDDGTRFVIGNSNFEVNEYALDGDGVATDVIDSRIVLEAALSNPDAANRPPGVALAARSADSSIRLLEQLTRVLGVATSSHALAEGILTMGCARLNVARGLLASARQEDNFEVIAARGFANSTTVQKLISTSVMKRILEGQDAVVIADTKAIDCNHASDSIQRNQIRSVACAPAMNSRGELCALLYFDNQFSVGTVTHTDAEFLIWLGHTYCILAENLAMQKRLQKDVETARQMTGSVRIVAESRGIKHAFERAAKAAKSDASVLILGESGSGKELVANQIHRDSARSGKPFVVRNCAAISKELFESEMFGHMKGSFTGAIADKVGAFEQAHGSTLFLDEIGDLNLDNQAKLLRTLQAGEIQVVGGKVKRVDVRVVAATSLDLQKSMDESRFRRELFFRIAIIKIVVPPLRERRDDIAPLARSFVERFSNGTKTLTAETLEWLSANAWKGNVRELEAMIREAVALTDQHTIGLDELNLSASLGELDLGARTLLEVEKRHINHTLKKANGNKTEAAKVLGIARSTLILKLKEFERFRSR